jgi:hypothetical protein
MEASALLDAEAARNTDLILSLRQELREANSEVARLQSMIGMWMCVCLDVDVWMCGCVDVCVCVCVFV